MLLEVKSLTRCFGSLTAVDRLSFSVKAGSICAFVGPNGAGKTTTMRCIATLDLPTSGDALVDGTSVVSHPEKVRHRLGFMPDHLAAPPNLTVSEYLEFFASCYGLKGAEKRRRLETVSEFLRLGELTERLVVKLSRGMSQRLGLARTLLHDPDLLVLDEPAAGLDPRGRVELRELLKAMASEGKGILVSSHILSELAEMSDTVVIIERGQLRAQGTIEQIRPLAETHLKVRVRFVRTPEDPVRFLSEQPAVVHVSSDGSGFVASVRGEEKDLAHLLGQLVRSGFEVSEFRVERFDLEDIFLTVTDGEVQ